MIENCYLRRATKNDMQLLYDWVNECDVRKNSFDSNTIELETHKRWFYCKLDSDKCDLYIYMFNQIRVGQIRLTYEGNRAVISYSIDKKYRGQGHGSMILYLAEKEILSTRKNIQYFDAEVKMDNIASKKKFEKLGYKGTEIMRYSKRLDENNNEKIFEEGEKK